MKKTLSLLLLSALLLSLLGLFGCGGKAPKTADIYDRVVSLVEASYKINTVLYGEGLPYYDRTQPIYASLYNDYTTEQYTRDYNIVRADAEFTSIEEIKAAASLVYSPTLLEETVYPGVFEGLITTDLGDVSHVSSARYLQNNDDLYILKPSEKTTYPERLIYDYSSMKIVNPSNATRVIISIDAWEESKPNAVLKERLTLVCVDNVWYLDSLTV